MIVHQQLAALTGKPSKKKKTVKEVVDPGDPIFAPSTPPAVVKKKKSSKEPKKVPVSVSSSISVKPVATQLPKKTK